MFGPIVHCSETDAAFKTKKARAVLFNICVSKRSKCSLYNYKPRAYWDRAVGRLKGGGGGGGGPRQFFWRVRFETWAPQVPSAPNSL